MAPSLQPVPILEIVDLHAYHGVSHILQGVSLSVGEAPLSVIGRNGMGKTTLCQTIMGLVAARQGRVRLDGRDLAGQRSYRIARAGIGYVPQGRRIFPSLSVHEHLALVEGPGRQGWTIPRVYETFPRLAERRKNGGAELSGGEQQMLAIARALLLNPRILIMDEPTEGLAPVVVDQVIEVLHRLSAERIGLLLIEQNFRVATAVSQHVLIMLNGRIALQTTAVEIMRDELLQRRYLGVSTRISLTARHHGTSP